ncbi:unnamed protein product [Coffea canephora]|uniref:UDP-glycosyltransferases domain-containing protein n=1 Tax=Coffea canephora TaxID=49390 RepID=A0A068UD97_COFCA|nr:unnamed protein product [Coffea canephora]
MDLHTSLQSVMKPFLKEFLSKDPVGGSGKNRPPFTSIIADGILSVALDVAEEIGLPVIYFRTTSAGFFWPYFCTPLLTEAGEFPFSFTILYSERNDMDLPIAHVKGMEGVLRHRDLTSFYRANDLNSPRFKLLLNENLQTPRAKGLILNTFEDLERPILSHVRIQCPNLYTIGPLYAHLKTRLQLQLVLERGRGFDLCEEDTSCIKWLDNQPPKSVLYVSFGSITIITREKLLEFWHGIVNSRVRFLWVIRSDSIRVRLGDDGLETDKQYKYLGKKLINNYSSDRGYRVGYFLAPQEEVLARPAIDRFLTHSGWNSTLESMVEGKPMICWPYFGDQHPNSRFVGELWKLGLDIKDTCDRKIVEKMIKGLMVERKDEFLQRANEMAKLARKSIEEGGSSFCNFLRLIDDIVKG